MNQKKTKLLIYIAVAGLLLASVVFGQGVEKRVVFTMAKTTVSYRGKLPRRYADYDAPMFSKPERDKP